ncbi:MAG: RNA methyltransferase [Verrucomicrobia bacterium]|nr:RNA methyltransferase [Verrucomicrobiota bacterium]
MPLTTIDSLQNPRIKRVKGLSQKRNRDKEGQFLLEGERELERGLAAGLEATQIMLCQEFFKHGEVSEALHQQLLQSSTPVVYLAKQVFEHCSYREHPDGFLAVCNTFQKTLDTLELSSTPLLLVLESLEKPGNLGTILRTADAAGVDALILNDPVTDLFNPNVIRTSAGVVFKVPTVVATAPETLDYLNSSNIHSYATTPATDCLHYDASFTGPSAIVMGSEKDGLTDFWIQNCTQKIRLPMHGQADSLNVGAATAAVLYEVIRQRR